MRDDDLHAKLDRVLAGHADFARRLDSQDLALAAVVQAVNRVVAPLAELREAVQALAEAAQGEAGGADLAMALRGLLQQQEVSNGHLAVISVGLERLPAIMEDTAVNAAALATGGGAGPRPAVPRPMPPTGRRTRS